MTVNKMLFWLLVILISTFCGVIILGCIGVAIGKVDAQYMEGLITGALLTLIMKVLGDISGQDGNTNLTNSTQNTENTGKTGATT